MRLVIRISGAVICVLFRVMTCFIRFGCGGKKCLRNSLLCFAWDTNSYLCILESHCFALLELDYEKNRGWQTVK